jgi:purine nucleosidase
VICGNVSTERAAGPILGSPVEAAHIHGDDGLGGYQWPVEKLAPLSEPTGALAIVDAANRYGKELTVVALGPLTNLALAIRLDPALPSKLGRVVSMGGSPAGFGNASINAEFNVYADPIAAEIVYQAIPLTLITWDLTQRVRFSHAELDSFWAGDSPSARLMRALHEHRKQTAPGFAQIPDFGRVDPLAMAIALDPSVTTAADVHAVVVGYGGLAHGLTSVDWRDAEPGRAQLTLPSGIDRARAIELFTV